MNKTHLAGALCAAVITLLTAPANAELVPRLNGQAAYDTVLDITWLTDADLSGARSWDMLLAWVDSLNEASYLGFDDWRMASMSVNAGLPTGTATSVVDCSTTAATKTGQTCRDNELGYMYHHNLGIIASPNKTGSYTIGKVRLTDIQPFYWSGTEFDSNTAGNFYFNVGDQFNLIKRNGNYAWVVRSGDVNK